MEWSVSCDQKLILFLSICLQVISTTITSTGGASFLPTRAEFKDWNASRPLPLYSTKSAPPGAGTSMASALGKDKRNSTGSTSGLSVPSASPSHSGTTDQYKDSAKGITAYFATNTRIQNGERFRVCGKRIGPDGKPQLLLEWDGAVTSSLF